MPSFSRQVSGWMKYAAYRLPVARDLVRPKYQLGMEPAQVHWLISGINDTKDNGGSIVEVGVALGNTSVFLMEHLRKTGDQRTYYCLDTFSGFTQEDIDHEVKKRNKSDSRYGAFAYNDRDIFERNMRLAGNSNFKVIQGDASKFDWASIAPIDVMLLDVDLYLTTAAVLKNSQPYWSKNARILLDDVKLGTDWDGSHQAYHEFCRDNGITPHIVGNKGGAISMG